MQFRKYSKVFITHLPSFYKINLYNRIAEHHEIHVCFVSSGSIIRTEDFSTLHFAKFSYEILFNGNFETRRRRIAIWKALRILRYDTNSFVVGGWDLTEFWIIRIFAKNVELALESTIFESKYLGLQGIIKKLFIRGVSRVYASGTPHIQLLNALNFKGEVLKTLGVGIINSNAILKRTKIDDNKIRLIFVGRMSPEKNIELLLEVVKTDDRFNLDLVGDGPLLSQYQKRFADLSHIKFHGYQSNDVAFELMSRCDVFVLPSKSETWGLVVEEALNANLIPVVSSKVGCSIDLIELNNLGFRFDNDDAVGLKNVLDRIYKDTSLRENMYQRVKNYSISEKDERQVQCYI